MKQFKIKIINVTTVSYVGDIVNMGCGIYNILLASDPFYSKIFTDERVIDQVNKVCERWGGDYRIILDQY